MAIPFTHSNEDDVDEALNQLIVKFIEMFEQLQVSSQVIRRAREQSSNRSQRERVVLSSIRRFRSGGSEQVVPVNLNQLPDLISNVSQMPDIISNELTSIATSDRIPSSASRPRRQRTAAKCSCYKAKTDLRNSELEDDDSDDSTQNWTEVGVVLRRIADDMQAPTDELKDTESKPSRTDCRQESLLSKLVPAPLSGGSLWTAVICAVGWLLFRAR